jgi:hypothetical protein
MIEAAGHYAPTTDELAAMLRRCDLARYADLNTSANGDLRTALEDLVTRLAEDRAGYARQPQANQGYAAIRHLIQTGHLPEGDGGMLLLGLWKLSHTNGPHPGQSDGDEARFRLQVITATARFLLKHLSAA